MVYLHIYFCVKEKREKLVYTEKVREKYVFKGTVQLSLMKTWYEDGVKA